MEPFVQMLTGGHPNSLGRTIEVVDQVLAHPGELEQLFQCYFSNDEVVRLRTSNALKRIWRQHPDWLAPYLDRFISEIALIDQASTRWTLAQLFQELDAWLSPEQRRAATHVLQRNLDESNDWLGINQTLQTLTNWAQKDAELRDWLTPYLARFSHDSRKSVSRTAAKLSRSLSLR